MRAQGSERLHRISALDTYLQANAAVATDDDKAEMLLEALRARAAQIELLGNA